MHDVLKLVIARTKIEHEKKGNKCQTTRKCQLEQPQSFYFEKLKEFANKLPSNTLLLVCEISKYTRVFATEIVLHDSMLRRLGMGEQHTQFSDAQSSKQICGYF